jgi:predicted metalloprotease with PDZ domain
MTDLSPLAAASTPADATSIHYQIEPYDPAGHLFRVTLIIPEPDPAGQLLRLPAWIPGSYMIRDFARNLVSIQVITGGVIQPLVKIDKSTWQLPALIGPVVVVYEVYAWDLSVRAAHFDQTHAYFNGASVFLEVVGQGEQPCTVDLVKAPHPEAAQWRVATTLAEAGASRHGFGRYQAQNYAELIDHPVEMADFTLATFDVAGVSHELVLSGRHYADVSRICGDLQRICAYHVDIFGKPAPMDRYLFIVWVVGSGYGGLEHRSSTSLICSRADLPVPGDSTQSDGYRGFLGLCSHEYFHTWHVKRIRPAAFNPPDLRQEVFTELLWIFEGFTSYYDDLALLRAGVISRDRYLQLIGQSLTRLARTPGRFKQSLAESSFDAWTRFYKQDENAANALVSYYLKGSVVALGLDLLLRHLSGGQVSLDNLMRYWWKQYGQRGEGLLDQGWIEQIAALVPGEAQRLRRYLQSAVYSTAEMDYAALFEPFGLELRTRPREGGSDQGGLPAKSQSGLPVWLGAAWSAEPAGMRLTQVVTAGPAHQAGLSAGDLWVAIDGLRVERDTLDKLLLQLRAGQAVSVHVFRQDVLLERQITPLAPPEDSLWLEIRDAELLAAWLPC